MTPTIRGLKQKDKYSTSLLLPSGGYTPKMYTEKLAKCMPIYIEGSGEVYYRMAAQLRFMPFVSFHSMYKKVKKVNSSPMMANDGQCLNLVSFSASN